MIPTAKQSLRRVIETMFPWVKGFVVVAGAKGKGLAIRAASGVLHLAGGPSDPAVARVTDKAGLCTVQITPSDASGTGLRFTNANGQTYDVPITFASGAVVVGPGVPPGAFELVVQIKTGSEKVTCA